MYQMNFQINEFKEEGVNIAPSYMLKKTGQSIPVVKFTSPSQVANYIRASYGEELDTFEVCRVFYINNKSEVLHISILSSGGLGSTSICTRRIFLEALLCGATAFVVAHNHPSGVLEASDADLSFSRNLVKAGEMLNIQCVDSIIVTTSGYVSLFQDGLL